MRTGVYGSEAGVWHAGVFDTGCVLTDRDVGLVTEVGGDGFSTESSGGGVGTSDGDGGFGFTPSVKLLALRADFRLGRNDSTIAINASGSLIGFGTTWAIPKLK